MVHTINTLSSIVDEHNTDIRTIKEDVQSLRLQAYIQDGPNATGDTQHVC